MRLSKIKLAGFKSFVDPTTVPFSRDLSGVVGPNGCGKSNIIDAVRWVMGESSAKNLRGESMADVIFNGSSARKPVGNASIELVFDNSDGTIGGQYAGYSEISIKRQVSRDGTSDYFLNNSRCRRKDITHIFLGTGLGPRSYSIIEQGTISRLVEARPEELRVFLEEAAGISKYKERRRETEHRIRHTRENLERLTDLRDEVEKQIRHLQRQARTAERYKTLRGEEREVSAQLLALRLRALDAEIAETRSGQESAETALQGAIAEQRAHESGMEKTREHQVECNDAFNEVQGRYYREGSEIAQLEQGIHHAREMRQRQHAELKQVEQSLADLMSHIRRDEQQLEELDATLASLEPQVEQAGAAEQAAAAAFAEAEHAQRAWQERWDTFIAESGRAQQTGQVERARIEQLEGQMHKLETRRARLEEERSAISPAELEEACRGAETALGSSRDRRAEAESAVATLETRIRDLRDEDSRLAGELDVARSELQQSRGRMASVEALQQAALGKTDEKVTGWLEGQGLAGNRRLAQTLRVAAGWEKAVETVLGDYLQAVCVDGIDPLAAVVSELDDVALSFMELQLRQSEPAPGTLADRVEGDHDFASLLSGVHTSDSLDAALAMRRTLRAGESVITPDGVWLGRDWLRVSRAADARSGVLEREEEMRRLQASIASLEQRTAALGESHERVRTQLEELESARGEAQREFNAASERLATDQARLDSARSRLEQARQRLERLDREAAELGQDIGGGVDHLREARARLEAAVEEMGTLETRRAELDAERTRMRDTLKAARADYEERRREAQALAIQLETRRSERKSAQVGLERMRAQRTQFGEREQALQAQLRDSEAPLEDKERQLAELLDRRVATERALGEARGALETVDGELRALEQQRSAAEQRVNECRETLDAVRLNARELAVRREGLVEQFGKMDMVIGEVMDNLPEDADVDTWAQREQALQERIQRLGPINLASIDELREQSERKAYLDSQDADLTEALETLENAIRKIDRETRTRFKETFDRVNASIGELFPRLFGGGHAYLELTGEDLLESGVTVMARPPGKRNSSIHLLSGGEKALTAVSLVFSIFRLNPAPFCLLDEVDAPLDDANVGRFCDIVREMSEHVQFIVITHNKTTMEMMDQLIGVTMNEPGVSRLVAVDIDEAVKMAAM